LLRLSTTNKYTLIGVLLGFLFPLIASAIISIENNLSLLQSQTQGGFLIWIIDTAPLFLGLVARVAGIKQETLEQLHHYKKNKKNKYAYHQYNLLSNTKILKQSFLIPSLTFLFLASFSFVLYSNYVNNINVTNQENLKSEANIFIEKFKLILNEKILAMDRMANRFININKEHQKKMRIDAESYISDFQGIEHILWINSKKDILWQSNQKNLLTDEIRNYLKNKLAPYPLRDKKSYGSFSQKLFLLKKTKVFFSYHATHRDGEGNGYMIALYDFYKAIENFSDNKFHIYVKSYNQQKQKFSASPKNSFTFNIKIRGTNVELLLIPEKSYLLKAFKNNDSFSYLAILIFISFIISLIILIYLMGQEKSKQFSLITQTTQDALNQIALITKTDIDGKIIEVNKKFIDTSGYSENELIGRDHSMMRSGFHSESFIKDLWDTITAGEVWTGDIKNKAKDGSEYWVDTSIVPNRDKNGLVVGYTAIRADITEKKKIEQEIIDAKQIAHKALKTKSSFLANMSHEIRTPLNGILGCTTLLLDNSKDPEDTNLLKTVVDCGSSLLILIDDLLDFSKLESEKMELENENFDLESSVGQVIQLFNSKASEKSLTLTSTFNQNIPTWVRGDVTRLKQILNNLISNAIKFTEEGNVEVFVNLIQEDHLSHKIQFSVKDQGIGMNDEGKSKLFKSFSQVDASTTKRFGGTGLGLAICKSLVNLMGGEIWIESQEGHGSTFFFTIVFNRSTEEKNQVHQLKTNIFDSTLSEKYPLEILVADDNTINQMVAKKLIGKLGYKVDIAQSGEEVLQMMNHKKYDLIFMDCHMPNKNGFQATAEIIEQYQEDRPKIVALTASAMKEDREKCLAAGMDDFVSKPIEIEEIVRVIKG